MRNIILISFTPLNDAGGVNRWNRDFIVGFPEAKHYSWGDVLSSNEGFHHCTMSHVPEWDKARILNQWLTWTKKIKKDDVIIVDGFWGLGLENFNVISVAHGIWSHLTKDDVDAGKQPEFPAHHSVQVNYRRDHLSRGGKIVAVSDFVAHQMNIQWGFESTVINNGIDLQKFNFVKQPRTTEVLNVVHGVTSANKGFDHIDAVNRLIPNEHLMLLDDAANYLKLPKYEALANCDLAIHPSAYEGFGYFPLEALACGVPIVTYETGFLWGIHERCKQARIKCLPGAVMDLKKRSPQETAKMSKWILESVTRNDSPYNPREVASLFSIEKFHRGWREYLEDYERHLKG